MPDAGCGAGVPESVMGPEGVSEVKPCDWSAGGGEAGAREVTGAGAGWVGAG